MFVEGHLWKVLIRTKFESSILWCLFGSTNNCVCTVSLAPRSIITIEIKLCKKFLFCFQPFEITLSGTELLNFSTFQIVLPQEEYDNLNNFKTLLPDYLNFEQWWEQSKDLKLPKAIYISKGQENSCTAVEKRLKFQSQFLLIFLNPLFSSQTWKRLFFFLYLDEKCMLLKNIYWDTI